MDTVRHTLSLSQLCLLVTQALEFNLDPTYWVEAEITSVSNHGHCYLELAERGENQDFAAKVRATIWRSTYQQIMPRFIEETGSGLKVGLKVKVLVSVEFHAVYGLSLNVLAIESGFTLGDLAKKRMETIRRLQEEDIIDLQKSFVLPTLVRRLAVISSDTAAGYQDFCHQLSESGYRFTTALYPATMQGDNAPSSIITALQAIEREAEEFDAVVIIRGGGATTDLSCFDSYELCRACALFPLPILSGIGHTRDISILDLVSHQPLKTPTAVADWLVQRMAVQDQKITDLRHRLKMTAALQIERRRNVLRLLAQRIDSCNPERIYRQGYSLLTVDGRVVRSISDIALGQTITSHLLDGEVESVVQDIQGNLS